MAVEQDTDMMRMPASGIGSIAAAAMAEDDYDYGDQGIASFSETTEKLAGLGRGSDSVILHASLGELVMPKEVLNSNPELTAQLRSAMENMGLDPDQYVIGSEKNSINPKTGLVEMKFSLKKAFKKLKKFVKKNIKPIASLALNALAPGLGTIASAAIGSTVGGLVQGENLGDALKSGVTGALTAGVLSGVSGMASGQTFMEGVQGGLPASYSGGINILPQASDFTSRFAMDSPPGIFDVFGTGNASNVAANIEQGLGSVTPTAKAEAAYKTALESTGDEVLARQAYNKALGTSSGVLKSAAKWILPSLLTGAATGAFDPIPPIPVAEGLNDALAGVGEEDAGTQLIEEAFIGGNSRSRGPGVAVRAPMVRAEDVLVPSRFAATNYLQPVRAATGGAMFPRRTGQIQGPGTETSDDIPAMLSDGEFVMTAQAVRGAGNGSREQGFKKMYDIMRAFEGGAVA
jgi:hypothetical protein